MRTINTDVLIIGGGGAALRAAIEASRSGVQVTLVLKDKLGKSGATAFQVSEMAGYNSPDGVEDKLDNPESYFEDMVSAGKGMADPKLAQIVAENAESSVQELDDWGVEFKKNPNGDYYAFLSCFSTKARTHVIKGHGEPIIKAMINNLSDDINILDQTTALRLLVNEGECLGVYALEEKGEELLILSKATILATGGAGQLFEKNMNPYDITGDGYALGYLAGADIVNMEFMQVGIGISYPLTSLINAYIWGGHPDLTDINGKSIFDGRIPNILKKNDILDAHQHHFPFSTSDDSKYLEICIQKTILDKVATTNGGVLCDFTNMTHEYVQSCTNKFGLHEMWPIAYKFLLSRGVDLLKNPVELSCFAHAVNGGLKINEQAKTTVNRLFAIGETAGGPHGADRLGGNMMLTCQVFGKIAGREAGKLAKDDKFNKYDNNMFNADIDEVKQILYKDIDVKSFKDKIKKLNQRYLLILRSENGLLLLKENLKGLMKDLISSPAGDKPEIQNVEIYHMIITSLLMTRAAEMRKESRGSHYREDIPTLKDEYSKPNILNNELFNLFEL
jgi:L-aspartate oxidase